MLTLKKFSHFILARQEFINQLMTLTDDDIRLINSALKRVESWPSCWDTAQHVCKKQLREKAQAERLTATDYQKFTSGDKTKKIEELFDKVTPC